MIATRADWIKQVLRFITTQFQPSASEPSKVPSYFFTNTAVTNSGMVGVLDELGLDQIQISHRIRLKND